MRIHTITGPPCSGKTTHAHKHKQPTDIIIDLDTIAHALAYPHPQLTWTTTHPAKPIALRARQSAIKAARQHPSTATAWIIDTNGTTPHPDQTTQLDPGPDECHKRATKDGRDQTTHNEIDKWYAANRDSRQW